METTTGPLGQGLGNAVGMAMAARRERGLFDPDAAPGTSPFDHFIYCFVSDGDIEEGISHEVSSLAGHQQLGNLIVIYDDNQISIEDDTNIAKSEDVGARYEAYGWHVQQVDWRTADGYHEDVPALYEAILTAKADTDPPSFIALRTIIGWPAPNKQNTGKAHGSALGGDEVTATKEILGFDPAVDFPVEDEALNHAREVAERGQAAARRVGAARSPPGRAPTRSAGRCSTGWPRARLPDGWTDDAARVPGRRQGHGHPQGVRRRSSPRSARCCPSCGAARPTWPRATTPRWRASRRSSPPTTRPRCARATRTAGRCTSASASTAWARS